MNDQINQSESNLSTASAISGIFFEPEKTFENIREHPSWLVPFIISIIMTAFMAYFTLPIQMEFQKDLILKSEKIPENIKDQQLQGFENPGFMQSPAFAGIMGVVMDVLYFVFTTLAILVMGNFIMGGSSNFMMVFSMVSWAGLIGVLEIIIKTIIMLTKGSVHAYTSLALFMDPSQFNTISFQLLNVFDVFTIWKLIVFIIGFTVFYKFPRSKAITGIVILFVIFTAIKIGWFQLMMSFV
jgi:Yip1 domain